MAKTTTSSTDGKEANTELYTAELEDRGLTGLEEEVAAYSAAISEEWSWEQSGQRMSQPNEGEEDDF